ncbi:unnamed protein product [Cladocopium goreaui]|uniref:Uncharacterized protein n=1 Tax=Cladocopium goreaui TaxID=2562237 RepID=A0A9P1FPP2_9DINO|nr:unnamed protein product [Cladocopium goreaui]
MATEFLGLVAFGAFHWKVSGTDVNFQWLQQLGGFFSQLTAEEAAQKERIQKNTATLRVSNYILFSHIFVHLAAWKTMWVVVGFVHSPQLTTGALMVIHLGLYMQHLLVVNRYIQPTSRQVRVLSAVVYLAYAAGYFLATALQDGPPFPNRAVTISEKYLLATRFFLVMAFIDTELSVVCQFFFSLTILGTSWYHGKELGYVQVTEECEIYGCLLAFVLIIDVMMRARVQACLQSADAEWMVSSFRRVLRGVCDCEFLLDHNLKIQGNPECLQHMLMSDEKLQGWSLLSSWPTNRTPSGNLWRCQPGRPRTSRAQRMCRRHPASASPSPPGPRRGHRWPRGQRTSSMWWSRSPWESRTTCPWA